METNWIFYFPMLVHSINLNVPHLVSQVSPTYLVTAIALGDFANMDIQF